MEQSRFVYRPAKQDFTWVHHLEVQPDHIDCTDMDDAQLTAFVLEKEGKAPEPQRCPSTGELFGE